jgi:hypothetical protein
MKMLKVLAFGAVVALGGCTSFGSFVSDLAISATSATPTQAKTVGEAATLATAAEKALDLYVTTGSPSTGVLNELNILVPAVHNALVKVEAANKAGNSALTAAALATFNEALAAYESYATQNGVVH